MAGTTSATLDDLFVNIVAQARFTAEEDSLMMGLIRNYNIAGTAGKTIQVPKYPPVTASALTEGTALTEDDVSTSSVAITVAEVGAGCLLTDLASMGAGNPAQELGTVLGNAIATKIDQDIIAKFQSFTATKGSANSALTVDVLFKAAALLKANNAKGQLVGVFHPQVAYDLKAALTNTFGHGTQSINYGEDSAQNVGFGAMGGDAYNQAMVNGFVGRVAGIDIYESANVPVNVGSGSNDSSGAIFTSDSLAIAMKSEFNLETQRNALRRGTEIVATAIYGCDVLEQDFGVQIISDGQAN
mgnify:CR=1 FL=1|tara:strand:+ start:707 stop:1606 length:900 start_codon:yes stop_codon:yes gene_type:complete